MPGAHPGQVRVDGGLAQLEVVTGQVAQRPGQAAVAVGDRVPGEQGTGPLQQVPGRREAEGVVRQAVFLADLGRAGGVVLEVGHGGLRTSSAATPVVSCDGLWPAYRHGRTERAGPPGERGVRG
ncbi:hypothetical protein [Streptomyces sp. WELS2]|uniref:hypothetical protein n=1 Tax=Streptomyces sp. WELS2 TaxID=2749435 RepID=UPI0015EFEA15